MQMIERRCEHPHPRIPDKPCNALHRFSLLSGVVAFECWRCHNIISTQMEAVGTEAGLTKQI